MLLNYSRFSNNNLTNEGPYDVHREDKIELPDGHPLNTFKKVAGALDVGVVYCLVDGGDVLSVGHEVGPVVAPPVSPDPQLARAHEDDHEEDHDEAQEIVPSHLLFMFLVNEERQP